ncbi:hypothetical protein TCCBUS3UF1_p310 (plasmid) [Thermus sp. CCB_US3_UF1]|nr:hypothetical protein TCCBUS3UF1_p310 [Thermus sp. CCB_US3_UF1]
MVPTRFCPFPPFGPRYNSGQWEDGAPLGPKAAGPREDQKKLPLGRDPRETNYLPFRSLGYPLPAETARGTWQVRGGVLSPTRKGRGSHAPRAV